MSWYLQHFFDPDLDYQQLKPADTSLSSSDLYNLCYVQNVIQGQILARLVPLEDVVNPDERYILDEPVLPAGANTTVDKERNYLLATCNGYVFYLQDRITVKKTLNVRQDISFATGNVFFVGDVAIHGSVRAGFEVQANNVLVKGMVEGGIVRARRDLAIVGGGRGGAGQHCLLDAGGDVRSLFMEKIEARSKGTMFVERSCLYSSVFAGVNLVVQERMYGGSAHVHSGLVVGDNLGNQAGVPTKVFLGYNPAHMRQLETVQRRIDENAEAIMHLTAVAGHLPPDASPASRKLANLNDVQDQLFARRIKLWESLQCEEAHARQCRLIVRGTVYPGVEIGIGTAYTVIDQPAQNVMFTLHEEEIISQPAPGKV